MFNKKFLFVILSIVLMIAMLAGCGDKTVEPEYVIPEELSVSYGSTLGDIPLPTGFSWQDDLSTSVGDVGQNTFLVTYTPEDLGTYKVVNDIQVTITVTKANPAYTAPQNLTAVYGQTLADVNLPTGFSWVDSTLSVGNVGKNSFNATYTPANVEKYNIIGNVTLQVEVGKAPGIIDDSAVVKTFIYNGNNQSISGATGTGEITYENNSFKNAGRYNVSINAAESDNYFAATKEIEVTVNKATYGEITFIGSSYSYDGTKKSIAIATELNNEISVKYYIGEDETNEAINAGTYEVTAQFIVSDNYEPIPEKKAILTITKIQYDISNITFENLETTYDGNEKTILISGQLPQGVTVEYENNKATNAGIFEAKAIFNGDYTNYEVINDMIATLKINKAAGLIDVTNVITEFTYTGNAQSIILATGTGIITYENNSFTDAGNYEVTINCAESNNYLATTKKVNVVVNKATITGITFNGAQYTYDGIAKSIAISGQLPNGCSVQYENNNKINAGTYEVTAIITVTENYNQVENLKADLVIKKADIEGLKLSGKTVTYDGLVHSIEVENVPQGAEVVYTNGNEFTNVGTYLIEAVISKENYNDVTLTETLEISKATYEDIVFNNGVFTYDGGTKSISISNALNEEISVKYYIDEEETNSAINAGVYTVVAKFTVSGNYNSIANKEATITINKATYNMSAISFVDVVYTYDATPKYIMISGILPQGVEVIYDNNARTQAGAVEATASFLGDYNNFEQIEDMKATLTINKASGSINDSSVVKSFTYNGTAQSISGATGTGGISYQNNSFTNAGNYVVIVNCAESENYLATSKEVNVVVNKATYEEIVFNNGEYTYDGESKSIEISNVLNDEISVKYYIDEEETNSAINAGAYTVVAKFTVSENYNSIANKEATLTINKANGVINSTNVITEFTYTGEAQSISGATGTGEITYEDNSFTNAGNYVVTINCAESSNYLATSKEINVVVNKANPNVTITTIKSDMDVEYIDEVTPPEYTMDAEGEVVIEYKVSGAEDNTYTTTKPTALGTYVVRVKFNGNENYTAGEDTLEFEITKKNPGLDITNAEDLNVSYGTTLPDPVITKATDATLVVEYKLKDAEDNTYTATKPTDAGIYCIKVSVEEMEDFLAGYIIVNFTISKVNNPDPNSVVTPTNLQADYGQTLGDIELPENWYWVDDEQTSVGDAGNNVFAVVYTSTNYINIQRNVTVSVNKIDWPMFTTVYDSIDNRDITVDTTGMYPKIKIQAYYGRTLSDFTFPAGWTVMYRAGTVDFSKGHDKAGGTYEQYNCLMATRNGDANHNDTTISHIEIDTYNPYVTLTITDDLSVPYGTSIPSITNDSYTAINQFGGPVYINDLSVEYYVNGQYTSTKPTEIGSYYCKISIPFSVYHNAAYCEKQFVISPKPVYVVDREEEIDDDKAYIYEIKSQYEVSVYDVRYVGFDCNSDIETAGIVAGSNTTTKYSIKLESEENFVGLYNNISGLFNPGTYDLKVSTTINSTYETVIQYTKLIVHKDEVDLSFVDDANVTLIYDSWYVEDIIFSQFKNKDNFDSEVSNNIYYKYKVFGADDSTYSEDMPEGIGTFVVKAFYDGSYYYEESESENTCTLVITIGEPVYTYFDGEYTISVNYVYAKTYISVEYLGEFEYDELENENFDNLHLNVYVYDDSIIVEGFEYTITGEHTMEPLDRGEVVYYSQICDGELFYISFNENKSGNKYVFIYWDYELSIEDIMAGEYNYECLERMLSPWYIENGKLYCEVYDVEHSFIIDGEENKFVTLNIGEVQYTYNIDGNTHKFCIVDGVNIEYVYDDEISSVVPYWSEYWTYEPDLKLIGYVDAQQMVYDFDAQLYRYYIFFNEETQKEEVARIDLDFVINYIYYEYAYEYNNELEQNEIMTYVSLFTTDYNERTKDYYECVFDGKHNYTFAEILDICEGDLSEYKTANIWGYDENGDYKILTLCSEPRMYILEDNTICPYQSNTTTPTVDYYYYYDDGMEYNDTYIFMSNGLYYCCEGTSILDPENTRYLLIDYGEYELNDDVIFVEGFGYFKVKNGSQKELEIYYGDIEYTYEDYDSNILKFCSIGDEKVCYLSEYNNENEKYYPDYIMYRWEFDEAVQVVYLIKLFEEQELTTLSYYIVGENTLEPTTNILYYGVIEAENNKVWTVVFTKPFKNNEEMFYMAQIFEGERVITFAEINDPHVCLECDYWGNYDWDGSSGWLDIYELEISYSYEKVNNLLVVLEEEHPM